MTQERVEDQELADYLERKEAGQECRLQWITKDGRRVWARLLVGPAED